MLRFAAQAPTAAALAARIALICFSILLVSTTGESCLFLLEFHDRLCQQVKARQMKQSAVLAGWQSLKIGHHGSDVRWDRSAVGDRDLGN